MTSREALREENSGERRQPLNPAEILADYFSKLTPEDFDAALAEAERAGDYDRLYGLTNHYAGDVLPASINRLMSVIAKEGVDQPAGRRQLQILRLLNGKWQTELPAAQREALADALIDRGRAADIYQSVNSQEFQFTPNQLDRIIARFNADRLDHKGCRLLVERCWQAITPAQLDVILTNAVEAKRSKIPEALGKLEEDYGLSLWAWEMSHLYNEPRPEPPTEADKEQHVENVCREIHELMRAIAEEGAMELPPPLIDLLISEGDRDGAVLRALATDRGPQLSLAQRQAVRTRLGPAELLTCLIDNGSSEADWISSEIDQILEAEPLAFAAIANEAAAAHLSPENIDLIVAGLAGQVYQRDWRLESNLRASLLTRPEKLSDEQFYAVFQTGMGDGWYKRHADFFTPERLDRFIANGPQQLVVALVRQGVADGDERLTAVLEKLGGRVELVDRCGHLFNDRHIDELIERTYHGTGKISKLIRSQPSKFSTGQLCKIIRRSFRRSSDTGKLQEECVSQLAGRVDHLLAEGAAEDLELILDVAPDIFSAEHALRLLRKINSARACWQLVSKFAKDLDMERLDDLIDGLHAKLRLLEGRKASVWDLKASLDFIIRERDDLSQGQLEKFLDNLRGSTAKALIVHRADSLSPAQLAEIVNNYSHVFEPRPQSPPGGAN